MIYFDRVFKQYEPGKTVLNNINFSISEGEFVSIVGPSGSGKTTILRMALGDERPTSGEVFFRSLNIHKLHPSDVPTYRRQMGVIFQDLKLIEDKTVAENIALTLEIAGLPERAIRESIREALEIVGLEGHEGRFPEQLSGGEKQRVAFARAIVNEPHILLADEPTAWLDPKNADNILDILDRIHEAGTTVVVTTHNEDIAKRTKRKHRILHIENGEIEGGEANGKRSHLVQ